MAERQTVNLSEMFDVQFPTAEERLEQAYRDTVARERFADMMRAPNHELPGLKAQLDSYLAAAFYLFPEETQVIHDSLERLRTNG